MVHDSDWDDTRADGTGTTDTATVREIVDGQLEITDAIIEGRIEVSGDAAGVAPILFAVEILLDVSTRVPALRALAADFHGPSNTFPVSLPESEREGGGDRELQLLARLDLLPDGVPEVPADGVKSPIVPTQHADGVTLASDSE